MEDEPDPLEETVREQVQALGPLETTLQDDPRTTLEPSAAPDVDTGGERALESLAEVGHGARVGAGGGLRLERTLGEGGMGIVHLAEQVALGRKVAVKTLKDERSDRHAKLRLLREAWVTGTLEHPNVVPVHDVGLDAEELPVIVLKRIEGVEWGELMFDADRVRERFGARDLLEWNLEILMQVCNAMHFAHSSGIVHRDLKPENVMIGEFGEVYVLDWGIAVSTRDDAGGRLPLASHATEMAGTPAYMAPEMLGGSEPGLSPRTDVYLLGATLHEILAGRPPHEGESPAEFVRSVLVSDTSLPETTPEELAAICRRAMAADPADRFDSAEAFRLALQDFLRHRGSTHLAEEASARLAQLERAVKAGPDEAEDEEARIQRLYNLFGECRFGFQQALREWPGNVRARGGLERVFETMVLHELSQGDPKAAGRLLAEMDEPPEALVARVERARREEDARRHELEELGRALDPHTGKRTRTVIALVLGTLFTLVPLFGGLLHLDAPTSHQTFVGVSLAFLAITLGLGIWARESMSKTLINRRIFGTVVFFLFGQLALIWGGRIMGLDPFTIRTLAVFLWGVVAGMVAIYLAPGFWAVTAGYLAAFVAVARWPEQYYWITAAANLNLTVFVVILSWNLPRYALPTDPIKKVRERVSQHRLSRRSPPRE